MKKQIFPSRYTPVHCLCQKCWQLPQRHHPSFYPLSEQLSEALTCPDRWLGAHSSCTSHINDPLSALFLFFSYFQCSFTNQFHPFLFCSHFHSPYFTFTFTFLYTPLFASTYILQVPCLLPWLLPLYLLLPLCCWWCNSGRNWCGKPDFAAVFGFDLALQREVFPTAKVTFFLFTLMEATFVVAAFFMATCTPLDLAI